MRDTALTSASTRRHSVVREEEGTASKPPGLAANDSAAGHAAHRGPPSELATIVGADPASQTLARLVARIAPSDVPVMIGGDAGTGKSVLARHIHDISGRSGMFVRVNCTTVAEQLTQGDRDGIAATNSAAAIAHAEHWFEAARQGTLFLDEIAALPQSLQSQLLRQLQEQEMAQTGTRDPRQTDVRLIATTTIDLGEAAAAGNFRRELFYRLNVGQVRLLPLRQRRGDVPALAAHFLRRYAARANLPPPRLNESAMNALTQHSWPGNVRELENVIRFALLVAAEQELRAEHLQLGGLPLVATKAAQPLQSPTLPSPGEPIGKDLQWDSLTRLLTPMFQAPRANLLGDLEQQIVTEAFRFTGRNQVRTAALLGISRNVLRTLLRRHDLLVVRRRKARASV